MSSTVAEADDTVEQRLAQLEERVCELEAENERLRDTVDELESELEDRVAVRWESSAPADIKLEGDYEYPLGTVLTGKAASSEVEELEKDVDGLLDDVHDLKVDGVDAADLVGTGDHDEVALPIEDTISALRSDVRDDPSANKQRATVLFRAFGGRAHPTEGRQTSARQRGGAVGARGESRHRGREPQHAQAVDEADREAHLRETAKRNVVTRDDENLITLVKGENGRLVLRADREEWRQYLDEVEGRYE